ncbi:hypothetical protein EZ449_15650 [Pedobacter frigidisoli]|uniref:Uncharacterized protein n=1 Tax=Pedobacter frigidisoli TaxID=2530455 RepID=A0A4R0NZB6_9SPHI|nr:hypothetical protein [Pedobacter frigidisoli]TCD05893.1 hypothetical protein EZ449_15650 [Pedobacter frigidisoli]
MRKKITVLIDLIGYGIVELPVEYALSFYTKSGRYRVLAACHIGGIDRAVHSWLCSTDFRLTFSDFDVGKGHTVCFSVEENINLYYHTMRNVVADYLALKENFFYECFSGQE